VLKVQKIFFSKNIISSRSLITAFLFIYFGDCCNYKGSDNAWPRRANPCGILLGWNWIYSENSSQFLSMIAKAFLQAAQNRKKILKINLDLHIFLKEHFPLNKSIYSLKFIPFTDEMSWSNFVFTFLSHIKVIKALN
jgi:hypothetical protein